MRASGTFNLPAASDGDGDSIIMAVYLQSTRSLPGFITETSPGVLTIAPTTAMDGGLSTIVAEACDG